MATSVLLLVPSIAHPLAQHQHRRRPLEDLAQQRRLPAAAAAAVKLCPLHSEAQRCYHPDFRRGCHRTPTSLPLIIHLRHLRQRYHPLLRYLIVATIMTWIRLKEGWCWMKPSHRHSRRSTRRRVLERARRLVRMTTRIMRMSGLGDCYSRRLLD